MIRETIAIISFVINHLVSMYPLLHDSAASPLAPIPQQGFSSYLLSDLFDFYDAMSIPYEQ